MRIGLVGCGHIGTVHAYALQQLADAGLVDAALVATLDEDPTRAARVARHHGGRPAGSLVELVEAVDVVWVCTWTDAHLAVVEHAASRGRAVFCEKPLAPTLEAAHAVAEQLDRVPHQVGLVLRWSPVFERIAALVHAGAYGRPLMAVLRDDQYFPIQGMYASDWRADVARAGGGTLLEHSIHDLDVLRWILGDPGEVTGRVGSAFGHEGIDDVATVTLTYRDGTCGVLASVWHQVLSRPSTRRLEVFCEEAVLWTDDDYLGPLQVQTSGGTEELASSPPEWADRMPVPEVLAKALAQYAAPSKAFLDGLAGARPAAGFPSAADR